MNSLKDELTFLLSGKGMPYEKVAIMVAVVVAVLFTIILGNNKIKDARVAIIDLDNSRYSHELIEMINVSPFMKVSAVLNTPVEPKTLFFRDQCVAVVYLPQELEKNRYTQNVGNIGVFYDNTNTAQTAEVKVALNEIIAGENQKNSSSATAGAMSIHDRNLFNPSESSSNGESLGFLYFFSSMFFVFATIGMIPRLRMEGKLQSVLTTGDPWELWVRLLPYGICLLTALLVGMMILHLLGDMVFTGNLFLFLVIQVFYIFVLGLMSLLFGWSAQNPGVAASRMILFIPGGFILGGMTGPIPILSEWVRILSHFFPLVWEYHFIRDIMMRGAGFWDCAREIGAFLLYISMITAVFYGRFWQQGKKLSQQESQDKIIMEGSR